MEDTSDWDYISQHDDEDKEPWHKGPVRYILGIFLLMIIVLMLVPYYGIKTNPSPKAIPTIEDIFPQGIEGDIGNKSIITQKSDYYRLIHADDPVVKLTADRIAAYSCTSTSRVCYAKAVFYFVRDNFKYVNDPSAVEYVKTAKQSLTSKGGDCDDASVLMASLLQAIGIRTRFVFEPGHVYIQALMPGALQKYRSEGDWVSLDGTCRYCEFGEISINSVSKNKNIV